MLLYSLSEDQPLSSEKICSTDQSAGHARAPLLAGPKGAPPAIPPIIINPFVYQKPEPAIDPRKPPPSPPIAPPARPAMSLERCFAV